VTPTWIICRDGAERERRAALVGAGVDVVQVASGTLGVDLPAALAAIAERGITRLLVEGGAQIAAALLRADLVDRLAWFHAPGVMGGDGFPAAQAFGVAELSAMPRFSRVASRPVGNDMLTELRRPA
jgi:diaminohydroxyphosphoribosylaminopyrimidine deaminase/5-amino-6-(5-phosphoribosylamino)uracil reductase